MSGEFSEAREEEYYGNYRERLAGAYDDGAQSEIVGVTYGQRQDPGVGAASESVGASVDIRGSQAVYAGAEETNGNFADSRRHERRSGLGHHVRYLRTVRITLLSNETVESHRVYAAGEDGNEFSSGDPAVALLGGDTPVATLEKKAEIELFGEGQASALKHIIPIRVDVDTWNTSNEWDIAVKLPFRFLNTTHTSVGRVAFVIPRGKQSGRWDTIFLDKGLQGLNVVKMVGNLSESDVWNSVKGSARQDGSDQQVMVAAGSPVHTSLMQVADNRYRYTESENYADGDWIGGFRYDVVREICNTLVGAIKGINRINLHHVAMRGDALDPEQRIGSTVKTGAETVAKMIRGLEEMADLTTAQAASLTMYKMQLRVFYEKYVTYGANIRIVGLQGPGPMIRAAADSGQPRKYFSGNDLKDRFMDDT